MAEMTATGEFLGLRSRDFVDRETGQVSRRVTALLLSGDELVRVNIPLDVPGELRADLEGGDRFAPVALRVEVRPYDVGGRSGVSFRYLSHEWLSADDVAPARAS